MATSVRQRCIRQALEDILLCRVCQGRLTNPRLLVCGHSACVRCLTQWYRDYALLLKQDGGHTEDSDVTEDGRDVISCPTCRKLTFLPPGGHGVNLLPADFNKNILLDILDSAADGGSLGSNRSYCTVCDITGRRGVGAKTPATAFCQNCRDHLCAPCLEEHNSLPLLVDHTVVVTPHGSHLSVLMCREHRNKSLDFFCHNCSKLICGICLRTSHRDHLAEGADDVSENRKRDIAELRRALAARHVTLRANGRAFNIDRRASAKRRVATFVAHKSNSFDKVGQIECMAT